MIYSIICYSVLAVVLVILILKKLYSPIGFHTLLKLYNGSAEDLTRFCEKEHFKLNRAEKTSEYLYECEKKLASGKTIGITYQLNADISDYKNRRTVRFTSVGYINRLHILSGLRINGFKLIDEKKMGDRHTSVYRKYNTIFSITTHKVEPAEINTCLFCSYEAYTR